MDEHELKFDESSDDQENEYKEEQDNAAQGNFDETQEISGISDLSDEERKIRPREEFTELNSADDLQKTRLMNSVTDNTAYNSAAENTVKRRKKHKKKKQINHTRTMGQVFLGVLIAVTSLAAGVVLSIFIINGMRDFTGMAKTMREAEVMIDSSMTSDKIVDELYKSGIINMPYLMKTYINLTDDGTKPFLTGSYKLYSNMSYVNIINVLKSPKTYTETISVTIPEGFTAKEIGELLEKNYVCRAVDFEKYYKSKLNKYDFEEGITDDKNRFNMLEGYLFPDTYEFYVIDDLKKNPNFDTSYYAGLAAEKMYDNFEDKITKQMKQRMEELGMTLDETVRLASLISWEGTNKTNKATISSVFHNRLNNPEEYPMLQSDTTYTYIDEVLTPAATATNKDKIQAIIDAYDTYTCEGYPAGAICNPGLEDIEAALYPDTTKYYYFVADKKGNFYWGKNIAEHEKNIEIVAEKNKEYEAENSSS